MICPYCGSDNVTVTKGTNVKDGYKRYRKCQNCKSNFSTVETLVDMKLGRPRVNRCAWCDKELTHWGYKYDGKWFCDGYGTNKGMCLKNYLMDKFDSEIEHDVVINEEDIETDELCKKKEW